jgi:hypothetical protein
MPAGDDARPPERVPVPAQPLTAKNPEFPTTAATASPGTRRREVKAMFVDDPRSSAEPAASLVDDGVRALIASVREHQVSLLAALHGGKVSHRDQRNCALPPSICIEGGHSYGRPLDQPPLRAATRAAG